MTWVAVVGFVFFATWAGRTALFPRKTISKMDASIREVGFRATLRRDAASWIPVVALTTYAACQPTFRIFWGVAAASSLLLAMLRFAMSFLVAETTAPPARSAETMRRYVNKRRMTAVVPLILTIVWALTWARSL